MSQIPRRSFTRLALAVLVPLTIMLIVWQYRDQLDLGGDPVRLTAEIPSRIPLSDAGSTAVDLKLTLLNRTGDTMSLTAAEPCKVLRWVVQAPGEATIQSKGDKCLPGEPSVDLASGDVLTRTETLHLEGSRYTAGVTYTLYVDFYGHLAKAEFVAEKAGD
jgi:hypothetical protein